MAQLGVSEIEIIKLRGDAAQIEFFLSNVQYTGKLRAGRSAPGDCPLDLAFGPFQLPTRADQVGARCQHIVDEYDHAGRPANYPIDALKMIGVAWSTTA
jgi:hypothetical protein